MDSRNTIDKWDDCLGILKTTYELSLKRKLRVLVQSVEENLCKKLCIPYPIDGTTYTFSITREYYSRAAKSAIEEVLGEMHEQSSTFKDSSRP